MFFVHEDFLSTVKKMSYRKLTGIWGHSRKRLLLLGLYRYSKCEFINAFNEYIGMPNYVFSKKKNKFYGIF